MMEAPGGRTEAAYDRASGKTSPAATDRGGWIAACGILLLTLVLALAWSHARLMWNDEFLSFYGDAVPTLGGVLRVQLHSPISLDPPTYHLLSHLAMDAVGRNGTALRLPALGGFLLMQISLFLLVRRIAGRRTALIAMALPLLTASFRYAVEGRPYGLLLGLYASSLTCWFFATLPESADGSASPRTWRALPLLGLFLSIALAITSHYFGVLILLPVCVGELVRTVERQRLDWPVVAALAAGVASVALILPGKAALAPYQRHYYTSSVNLHHVTQGYRELFLRFNTWPLWIARIAIILLVIGTVSLFIAMGRRFRTRPAIESKALWAALFTLILLPFFGYLFAKFVTHTMEVRYVIAALIPFAVSIALLMKRPLASTRFFYGAIATVLVVGTLLGVIQIRDERRDSDAILQKMTATASLHDQLAANPSERLYTQSLTDFFLDGYYAPDPLVRQRITLVYDEPTEVHWLHHNTNAVTAENLQQFSDLKMQPYPQVLATPGALLLYYHNVGWEWSQDDLLARHMPEENLGREAGGILYRLQAPGHE